MGPKETVQMKPLLRSHRGSANSQWHSPQPPTPTPPKGRMNCTDCGQGAQRPRERVHGETLEVLQKTLAMAEPSGGGRGSGKASDQSMKSNVSY